VGAGRGWLGLSGVVSNLIFFFGFWYGVGKCGLSGLEVGLVHFFVVGVIIRRGWCLRGARG
jgi:hypothetical protein